LQLIIVAHMNSFLDAIIDNQTIFSVDLNLRNGSIWKKEKLIVVLSTCRSLTDVRLLGERRFHERNLGRIEAMVLTVPQCQIMSSNLKAKHVIEALSQNSHIRLFTCLHLDLWIDMI
jgi:hypothetical protein